MKAKGILCLILSAAVMAGATACSQSGTVTASSAAASAAASSAAASSAPSYMNTGSEYPIVKDGTSITLSIAISKNDTYGADPENLFITKWCEKKMNIKFQFTSILNSALAEQKKLMFASQNLPDILLGLSLTTNELETYGEQEKQLLAMNGYLNDAYAPTICQWFKKYPTYKTVSTCLDGNLYTLPGIFLDNVPGDAAYLFVNDTWLSSVGMTKPKTLDELMTVLRAFKKKYGESCVPLGGSAKSVNPGFYILNALGYLTSDSTGLTPCLRNGSVTVPCGDETFKEYLQVMNTLYTEGLISPDFFTIDKTQVRASAAAGNIGMIYTAPYSFVPNSFKEWSAVVPLTSDANTKQQWLKASNYSVGNFAISASCKYPEVAMRFADYFFTDQGAMYAWSGPMMGSADTLGLVTGWYIDDQNNFQMKDHVDGKFTSRYEEILKTISAGTFFGNLTQVAFADQEQQYRYTHKVAGKGNISYSDTYDVNNGENNFRLSCKEYILPYCVAGYPTVTYFSSDDTTKLTDLQTVIKDYVTAETAKFITGARPLSEFSSYLSSLKSLGYDSYVKYYSDYYAKFYK